MFIWVHLMIAVYSLQLQGKNACVIMLKKEGTNIWMHYNINYNAKYFKTIAGRKSSYGETKPECLQWLKWQNYKLLLSFYTFSGLLFFPQHVLT